MAVSRGTKAKQAPVLPSHRATTYGDTDKVESICSPRRKAQFYSPAPPALIIIRGPWCRKRNNIASCFLSLPSFFDAYANYVQCAVYALVLS
jgi:hypothetical protein